ncbi:MAG: STAS domain-containing protein [Bermanella sp.]
MPLQQIEKHQSGAYGVIGDLTFESVIHVEKEGLTVIKGYTSDVVFDLGAVKQCSSAVLALLLSWVRAANVKGIGITFKAPPAQLRLMVENAQLHGIIPLVV